MQNSKSYILEGVGTVQVVKHSLSRRISIKLKPGQPPKVVIPRLMPFNMGFGFAMEKRDWIIEHLPQMELIAKRSMFDEQHPFQSRLHAVRFCKCETKCVQAISTQDGYEMRFPQQTNFASEKVQHQIRMFLTEMLKHEAKEYLPKRTAELATECKFSYNKLTVKDIHTRWGSCSAVNNINLTIHLMRLPEHLSDFVILHELCHTIHKNHGAGFHDLLNKLVCGREKELNKELNKYKIPF